MWRQIPGAKEPPAKCQKTDKNILIRNSESSDGIVDFKIYYSACIVGKNLTFYPCIYVTIVHGKNLTSCCNVVAAEQYAITMVLRMAEKSRMNKCRTSMFNID